MASSAAVARGEKRITAKRRKRREEFSFFFLFFFLFLKWKMLIFLSFRYGPCVKKECGEVSSFYFFPPSLLDTFDCSTKFSSLAQSCEKQK